MLLELLIYVARFVFFSLSSNVPWSKFFISDSEQKKISDFCDNILDVWASLQLKIFFFFAYPVYCPWWDVSMWAPSYN